MIASALADFRAHFPIFRHRVYVNSCSQGALSTEVERAVQAYLESWHEQGSPWEHWVEVCETLRIEYAALIGASPDEIAIMPSATCAIGAISTALSFETRPDVVMGTFEFPTMAQGWHAAAKRGARVRWVEADGQRLDVDAYARVISSNTAIVPIAHVCFRNGVRVDVAGVAAICRERGAYVFLDDYQSTGTFGKGVRELGVDMMVTGALKYLLGPSGIAFLYVRREIIERFEPLVTGWFGRRNPFAFDITAVDWPDTARRFEGGSPPVINAYAALAGIRLLRTLERSASRRAVTAANEASPALRAIQAHVSDLSAHFMDGCAARGFDVLTPHDPARRGPLVVLGSTDAPELVKRLATHGVTGSARGNGLRVSFHAYNNRTDVDEVLQALEAEADLVVRSKAGSPRPA
ncbi:MAG: aminotransferase class V-fold PLP-dependent enzyme [Vicinamibacterales bacterium]